MLLLRMHAVTASATLHNQLANDLPRFSMLAQLQYFDPIMAWLREQHEAPTGFLHGALDLAKLAVAGHSRGGKLAGLLYAGTGVSCVGLSQASKQ